MTSLSSSQLKPVYVLLASQVLFWTFLYLIESRTQPESFQLPESLPLYLSDEQGQFDLSETPIQVPYNNEPAYIYTDKSGAPRGLFHIQFEAQRDDQNLAFFIGWDGKFVELRLNGELIPTGGKNFQYTNMSGFAPGLYQLPNTLLQEGENTLGVVVAPRANKFISHFAIGDRDAFADNYRWGQGVAYMLPLASFGAALFVLMLCVVIPWAEGDRAKIAVFAILLAASVVRNMQFFGLELVATPPWNHVAHFAVVNLLLLAFPAVAMAWTGASWYSLRWVGYAYVGAMCAVVAGIPLFSFEVLTAALDSFFYWGWWLETILTVAAAMYVVVRLLRHAPASSNMRLIEFTIILFCMTVILVEHLDHRFQLNYPFIADLPIKNYFTSIVSVVLPLGLCTTVVNESVRARQALADVNEELEDRLKEKEDEIRGQARDRATLDERRRLMRDMHDGLGANLSTLLLRTRTKDMPYESVPGAVQDVLDELRLMVDSLDSAGDTLAVSLGAFRQRAESRLSAAGITLNWDVDPDSARYECSASEVLQIYRILQEATSNAVAHSGADSMSFTLKALPNSHDAVQMVIQDNGSGLPDSVSQGKGIRNMRERAERIGARLRFENTPGVTIYIVLPGCSPVHKSDQWPHMG